MLNGRVKAFSGVVEDEGRRAKSVVVAWDGAGRPFVATVGGLARLQPEDERGGRRNRRADAGVTIVVRQRKLVYPEEEDEERAVERDACGLKMS